MTRLFRYEGEDTLKEVHSQDRLAGLADAALNAEKKGDGTYVYDYMNGQYHEFNVEGGKVQQFAHDAIKQGQPAVDHDRSLTEASLTDNVSTTFGTIFPSEDPVESDKGPAYEEF